MPGIRKIQKLRLEKLGNLENPQNPENPESPNSKYYKLEVLRPLLQASTTHCASQDYYPSAQQA